jgi:4-O-beta-D-mannosyl-D-glucose phosphorylase
MKKNFEKRLDELKRSHKELIKRKNRKKESSNGIYERFEHPVLTAKHTPYSEV